MQNMGWGKRFLIVVGILMVLNIPQFIEIHGMLTAEPSGPMSSSEYPLYEDCLATVGTSQAAASKPQSAFCNCYTAAAVFQHLRETPYPQVPEADYPLLLEAIAHERPGETQPQESTAQSFPAHVEGFVSAVLPECRGRAFASAARERRIQEGPMPEARSASNRQPGGLHAFHETCIASQGVSWRGATIAQKTLCQCYYVESRHWNIAAGELPDLLQVIAGDRKETDADARRFGAFLQESLPRCRKRAAAIAATDEGR